MSTMLDLPLALPSSSPQSEQYANSRKIGAEIASLLNLFWKADEPQAVRDATVKAWIEDLAEFAAATVASACKEWRRNHSKRPHIADIRQLCVRTERPISEGASASGFVPPPKRKLPDDLIRQNWRDLHVREWTKFELATANMEALVVARKHGFDNPNEHLARSQHATAALSGRCPPYDVKTGGEGTIRRAAFDALEDVL